MTDPEVFSQAIVDEPMPVIYEEQSQIVPFEEPASKRVKLDEPLKTYTETFVVIAYDFEARGEIADKDSAVLFGAETLASFGAAWFEISFVFDEDGDLLHARIARPSASDNVPLVFEDVFPTTKDDQEWEDLPVSASEFWAKNPAAFESLKAKGHVKVDKEKFDAHMRNSADQFVQWMDQVKKHFMPNSSEFKFIVATDTATADSKRLHSFMSAGGYYSPPYNTDGKWNGVRELNYDQLVNDTYLNGKLHQFNYLDEKLIPVQRDHTAGADALAQSYECMWALLWAIMNEYDFNRAMEKVRNGAEEKNLFDFTIADGLVERLYTYLTRL